MAFFWVLNICYMPRLLLCALLILFILILSKTVLFRHYFLNSQVNTLELREMKTRAQGRSQ